VISVAAGIFVVTFRYITRRSMPRTFKNPWPHETHGFLDVLKWKLGGLRDEPVIDDDQTPARLCRLVAESMAVSPEKGWRVTWLGHASFLLQGCGASILIDPIFSDHCAPLPLAGMKRKVAPPCGISDLPPIDAILITHGHYDHLDLPTLRAIGGNPEVITAEGHAKWLSRKLARPVGELAWHESRVIGRGIRITATPAQHFTARTPFDRDRGHWCGWLVEGEGARLWHAGDSGYCPAFLEIGERYGPIDFGMIPIGAYQPRAIMKPMHMNPEEAVRAFADARCRRAVAMHWGTFVLTDEPMQEPPARLRAELARRGMDAESFVVGDVGGQWKVG
jgi:N-acyl-phosphatidylethanolamine-hydrolysing phospholipase D